MELFDGFTKKLVSGITEGKARAKIELPHVGDGMQLSTKRKPKQVTPGAMLAMFKRRSLSRYSTA